MELTVSHLARYDTISHINWVHRRYFFLLGKSVFFTFPYYFMPVTNVSQKLSSAKIRNEKWCQILSNCFGVWDSKANEEKKLNENITKQPIIQLNFNTIHVKSCFFSILLINLLATMNRRPLLNHKRNNCLRLLTKIRSS